MTPLETALTLRATGTACIPVAPDKRPLCAWARYQTALPSDAECRRWFANGASIAVVAGAVQCLDVDVKHADPGLWDRLLARLEAFGLGPLVERLLIQRTPSGGYHMVWRCDAPLRNLKLAENPRREVMLETRGHGGYFVAHPSPGYVLIQGEWGALPVLTEAERDDLLAVARSFNERTPTEPNIPPPPAGKDTKPGEEYDDRGAAEVPALLRRHGWTPLDPENKHWRRPGKESGVSASWNVIPNRFWVWTTSTAFESQHVYRPWHVFAVLECEGNFGEAARRLAAMGYGAPSRVGTRSPITPPPPTAPPVPGGAQAAPQPQPALPPILSLGEEEAQPWVRPPEIVKGVLFRGAKMMIAGPSKARKTFVLTDLAVSVATGTPWLGFATSPAEVLYVNLELQSFAFRERRQRIVEAKVAANTPVRLWTWHLRGYGVTLPIIRKTLMEHCLKHQIGMLILDPTYKLNQQGQENAAEDVGRLLNEFEQVAREADAAVVFCHHFAKGTAAEKA
ncbi:MAG: AAA family ATPase, partial [Armatimonadetes bacterium]|nr:AAA family ATPase [Armatimonadota bacterium]